jgi:hypothetical protein
MFLDSVHDIFKHLTSEFCSLPGDCCFNMLLVSSKLNKPIANLFDTWRFSSIRTLAITISLNSTGTLHFILNNVIILICYAHNFRVNQVCACTTTASRNWKLLIISLQTPWLFIKKIHEIFNFKTRKFSAVIMYILFWLWNYCDDVWQVKSKILSSDKWGNFYYLSHTYVKILNFNTA